MAIRHDYPSEYTAWISMRRRCNDPKRPEYPKYGGAGITYAAEWESFDQFMQDMGPKPSSVHSLDRIDCAPMYSKATCRWATKREQTLNRSTTVWITHEGETMCVADWARRLGLDPTALYQRLKTMTPEQAVSSGRRNRWSPPVE